MNLSHSRARLAEAATTPAATSQGVVTRLDPMRTGAAVIRASTDRPWLHGLATYLPRRILTTDQLAVATGKPAAWFTDRTGIDERRRAGPGETAETMAIEAVRALERQTSFPLADCDLVIGATYTPSDTIGTLAHRVQRAFSINNSRVLQVSAACTSALVAVETARAFLRAGLAKSALVVAAEHNSLYSDDADERSGHLWGDAAAAMLVSSSRMEGVAGFEIVDVETRGLAYLGQGPDGIVLNPRDGGLQMPHGKDVFAHACRAMEEAANAMLRKHGMTASDLALLVPHQANQRIVEHVAARMGVEQSRCASTIRTLGNTGCVSPLVSLLPQASELKNGDLVLMVAFGGGYSVGTALLRRMISEFTDRHERALGTSRGKFGGEA